MWVRTPFLPEIERITEEKNEEITTFWGEISSIKKVLIIQKYFPDIYMLILEEKK